MHPSQKIEAMIKDKAASSAIPTVHGENGVNQPSNILHSVQGNFPFGGSVPPRLITFRRDGRNHEIFLRSIANPVIFKCRHNDNFTAINDLCVLT
jgi:hypothetical protein